MIKITKIPTKKDLEEYSKNFNQIFIEIKDKKHLKRVIEYFRSIDYLSNYESWKTLITKDEILSNIRSINPNDLKNVHYLTMELQSMKLETNIGVKVEFSESDYNSLANEKIIILDIDKSKYIKMYIKKKLKI